MKVGSNRNGNHTCRPLSDTTPNRIGADIADGADAKESENISFRSEPGDD